MKIKKKPSKRIVHSITYSKVDDHTLGETQKCSFEYTSQSKINYLPGKEFAFFPFDQINLLLAYAESAIFSSKNILEKFEKSRKIKNEIILSAEQDEILNDLILELISIPIAICSAIEAFANQQIYHKKNKFCDHFFIQRRMSIEDKLFKILPRINYVKIDKKYESQIKMTIDKIVTIRNSIIHQKLEEGKDNTSALIENILRTDWGVILEEIKIMMEKYQDRLDDGIPTEDLSSFKTKK